MSRLNLILSLGKVNKKIENKTKQYYILDKLKFITMRGRGGGLMTLLSNFTRGVVTAVMKRHTGGEGVKKRANWRYVINEWPLGTIFIVHNKSF